MNERLTAVARQAEYSSAVNAIRVHNLTKRYGETLAVDDIDFAVPPARPSGCWAATAPARPRRSPCCSAC